MSYHRLLVLYALILLLVAAQTYSMGDDHTPGASPETAAGTPRPDADTQLSSEIAKTLAKLFPIFTETSVKEHYGSRLPKAFDELKKGNEDGIADVIGEIFGTLNDQQVIKLIEDVDAELKAEGEKAKEKQDANKIALLKRLKEAALSVKKQDGDKELAKFREAFEKKFKDVRDKNKEFYTLLDEALTNDAAKRKLLAGGYDPELLLRFAKEQCATGNESLCDKLAKGLTFEDTKTGDRFIDVVSADNKNQRLVIPKDSNFKDSLADISDQTKGFAGFKLAAKPHETVDAANIVRAKKGGSGTPPPQPKKDDGKKMPDLTKDPAPIRKKTDGDSGRTGETIKPPTDAVKLEEKKAAVAAIAESQCFGCHGKNSGRATTFDENGKMLTGSVQLILDRTTKVTDPKIKMPKGGSLSTAEADTIKEWAKLQGVN